MLATLTVDGNSLVLARFDDAGGPIGRQHRVDDVGELGALEDSLRPRWLFDSATEDYARLLQAGVRVRRCHDIALTERILLGRAGRHGQPCRAAAVLARARGEAVPDDPTPIELAPASTAAAQPGLFEDVTEAAAHASGPADLVAAYLDQQERIESSAEGAASERVGIAVPPGALRLLIAAESSSALVAAEMTHRGLPWDVAVHDRILSEILGPRPAAGGRPAKMAALAADINEAFGFAVNPDSPIDLRDAFRRCGFDIATTRAWVLKGIDHPAVAPVLAYKDLARLYTANGWNWLADWVSGGRLVCQFLPGEVVSGRWATRGGGGLQLPRSVRGAAIAHPGHVLVVADAAQLEPRILAAVSRDAGMVEASAGADLYAALAADGFGGDRRHAKLAMLGAMYGQTTGEAARLMATLRVRYPAAVGYVEAAARRGEAGAVVRSVLGRACPPPSPAWHRLVGDATSAAAERKARQAARDRGRFTRNFVIQASAADWAAAWQSQLRLSLFDVPGAELVFFQHDELVVHVPVRYAEKVCELTVSAARTARDLVFPGSAAQTPVRPVAVTCYADAK